MAGCMAGSNGPCNDSSGGAVAEMTRWGIQVPFPDWESPLWVIEDVRADELKPLSFGTNAEAQKHGMAWKTFRVAEIAE